MSADLQKFSFISPELDSVNVLTDATGSARTVNRRYIADFISKENRTKASAGDIGQGFVSAEFGLAQALSADAGLLWCLRCLPAVT